MIKVFALILITLTATINTMLGQEKSFSNDPNDVIFHTEDITSFWKVFDASYPKLKANMFQEKYIDTGSVGLQGFLKNRIENGKRLAKVVTSNMDYYQSIRESSISIDSKKERFYECFENLKEIYPEAVFPDVYFVIGAKNSGGTAFKGGLIIGAEMFGQETSTFKPRIDINQVDEVVAHELVHFQQKYAVSRSLLSQCLREGSADFICELIAGGHSNAAIHAYGDTHEKELWTEFVSRMNGNDWSGWLYYQKDKSRPNDLGYWIGYKITKAYYDKASDKAQAVRDILTIQDFNKFLANSGYEGKTEVSELQD